MPLQRTISMKRLLVTSVAAAMLTAGGAQAGKDDNSLVYGQSIAVTDL